MAPLAHDFIMKNVLSFIVIYFEYPMHPLYHGWSDNYIGGGNERRRGYSSIRKSDDHSSMY